jgi:hypothetical protein
MCWNVAPPLYVSIDAPWTHVGHRPATALVFVMNRKTAFNVLYVVVALLAFLIIQDFYQSATRYRAIPYSRFEQLLNGNKIDKVWVEQNSISGTLKVKEKDGLQRFITTRVNSDLAAKLDQHHVTFFGEVPTNWLSDILSWVVPALLFFVVWTFVMRRFGQQGFGGTRSQTRDGSAFASSTPATSSNVTLVSFLPMDMTAVSFDVNPTTAAYAAAHELIKNAYAMPDLTPQTRVQLDQLSDQFLKRN